MTEVDVAAEVIVEGRITGVRYDLRRTMILSSPAPQELPFTAWTLDVLSTTRGVLGNQIDVAYAGGSFDGIRWIRLADAPEFEIGERVVLYADPDDYGAYRMVNWEIGILRQRIDSMGREVVVDGVGRAIESLPCDTVPTLVSPAEAGGVDVLDLALSWSDALVAVSACAQAVGGAP